MITTLFMLMSLDGKISTGSGDERDFDKDLPNIPGAAEGLKQYYDLELETDLYSFNTGKVMAKVGWNETKQSIDKIPVTFVLVDNQPHLTKIGIENLLRRCEALVITTTNPSHPALEVQNDNLEVIQYTDRVNFKDLFSKLDERGVEQMTVQSGGDMNATLVREGLVNEVSIVVAPALVGGRDTPSLIGGDSLLETDELSDIKTLELVEVNKLDDSYLHLRYKVHV